MGTSGVAAMLLALHSYGNDGYAVGILPQRYCLDRRTFMVPLELESLTRPKSPRSDRKERMVYIALCTHSG